MAIITEHPHNGRYDMIRHASDSGMMIRQKQTGHLYAEAVDIYPTDYEYIETSIPIISEMPKEEPNAGDE